MIIFAMVIFTIKTTFINFIIAHQDSTTFFDLSFDFVSSLCFYMM